MSDLLKLIIAILISYRLSLFVYEGGPSGLFGRLRSYLGKKASGNQYGLFWNLAELSNCALCLGVWIALVLSVLFFSEKWYVYWFAVAGAQTFLVLVSYKGD